MTCKEKSDDDPHRAITANGTTYVMCCSGSRVDRDHLFFQFNLSIRVWTYLQVDWQSEHDMRSIATQARKDFDNKSALLVPGANALALVRTVNSEKWQKKITKKL